MSCFRQKASRKGITSLLTYKQVTLITTIQFTCFSMIRNFFIIVQAGECFKFIPLLDSKQHQSFCSLKQMQIVKLLVGLFQALAILAIIMFTRFHRKDKNASTIVYFIITGAILIFLSSSSVVEAHGNGAPTSRCETMVPGHWVDAQATLSPYEIHVDKTAITPGDRVNITLKTVPGQTGFKGFFIMVKEAEDEFGTGEQPPINKNFGKFDLKNSDMSQAQPVNCFDKRNSAMTHVVNYVKDSVELSWIAPKLISEDQANKQTKHGRPYMQKELKIV